MSAKVNHQFDMIINALKDAGIYNDSAIFLFSDHGDFTGNYGLVEKTQNTFEIKPPSNIKVKPGICNALVELIDFPATVEALADLFFH